MNKLVELMHNRIANISVSASTVRGQPKHTAKRIRTFLKNMNLSSFKNVNDKNSFQTILDKLTSDLRKKMPKDNFGKGNFGFARKCLNIFLFEICHNEILDKEFDLKKLIPFLEVPLDNPNEKELRKQAKISNNWNWEWTSIKVLDRGNSNKIQSFARDYMKTKWSGERVYFELINWRRNK